jgi:hypothetical protein
MGTLRRSLQIEKSMMVRTCLANYGMNNTHDDVRTSRDCQATIDLLNKRVAQLERDLAERDAGLRRHEEKARMMPNCGGDSNSQASGQLGEKENLDDCGGV